MIVAEATCIAFCSELIVGEKQDLLGGLTSWTYSFLFSLPISQSTD